MQIQVHNIQFIQKFKQFIGQSVRSYTFLLIFQVDLGIFGFAKI